MVLADPVILPEPFYHHPEASASSDLYGARNRRSSWPSREAMRESLAIEGGVRALAAGDTRPLRAGGRARDGRTA